MLNKTYLDYPDERLVVLFNDGDNLAINELVKRYRKKISGFS